MSIWGCFETYCWSSGFDYKEYISYKENKVLVHAFLSEPAYHKFCELLDSILEEDMKNATENVGEAGCDVDTM